MRNRSSHSFPPPGDLRYEEQDDSADEEDSQDRTFRKKQKLDSFVSNKHDAAPQSRWDTWTEGDVFMLLEVWGARYMELGRKSLMKDDWNELVDKLLEMSGVQRTVAECRSQLDVLKNEYKKERAKFESSTGSNWVFLKKMNELLNPRIGGFSGLGRGFDAGEYVFKDPQAYLNKSNVWGEMSDSPVQSGKEGGESGRLLADSNQRLGRVYEKVKEKKRRQMSGGSVRLVAESTQRLGTVYEKVKEKKRRQMGRGSVRLVTESIQRFGMVLEKVAENNTKHMMDLEKMRKDILKELEVEKNRIMERTMAELAKIWKTDGEDDNKDNNINTSVDNLGN